MNAPSKSPRNRKLLVNGNNVLVLAPSGKAVAKISTNHPHFHAMLMKLAEKRNYVYTNYDYEKQVVLM